MSIEQQPNNLPQETPTEALSNLDYLEAEALQAQQAATQVLQEIATHKARQTTWAKPNSKKSQKDFDTVQAHLGSALNRDLYADTIQRQSTPEPAQLLKLKQEALARGDKTAVMDIRNHKNGTDQLADVLTREQLSRRELAELRRKAIDYGDQDSVLTIQNALSVKMGLTQSAPEDQQAAFTKLDRLYKLAESTPQPQQIELASATAIPETEPVAQTTTLDDKETKKPLHNVVAPNDNLILVAPDMKIDTKVEDPITGFTEVATITSAVEESTDERATTADQPSVVAQELEANEELPTLRPALVLVPNEVGEAESDHIDGSAEPALKGEDHKNLQIIANGLNGETNLKGNFFRQSLTLVRNELRPGGRVVVSEKLDDDGNPAPNGQSLLMSRDREFYEKRNAKSEDKNSDKSGHGDRPSRTRRLGNFANSMAMMSEERIRNIRSVVANRIDNPQDPRSDNDTLEDDTEKPARKTGQTARRVG